MGGGDPHCDTFPAEPAHRWPAGCSRPSRTAQRCGEAHDASAGYRVSAVLGISDAIILAAGTAASAIPR